MSSCSTSDGSELQDWIGFSLSDCTRARHQGYQRGPLDGRPSLCHVYTTQHSFHVRSFTAAVFWLVESFNGAAAAMHQMSSHAVAITEFSMSKQPFLFVGTRGGRVMH